MNTLNNETILSEIKVIAAQAQEVELHLQNSQETLDGLKLTSSEAENLIEKLESDIEDSTSDVETLSGEIEELEDTQREVARDIENLEGEKRDIESILGVITHDLEDVGLEVEEEKNSLEVIKERLKVLERAASQHLTLNKMLTVMGEAGFTREHIEEYENYLLVVEKEDYFIFIYDDKDSVCRYFVNKFYKSTKEFGKESINKNSIEQCLELFLETI